VGENNIPKHFEYGKGWWDYVELVRQFASKFDIEDLRVVGHYVVDTPPPEEKLPMPSVALSRRGVLVALKHDFRRACAVAKGMDRQRSTNDAIPGTDRRAVRSYGRSATAPR
jgi:hypothetical protein